MTRKPPDVKRCPYCLGPVNRPRAKYCDTGHARKAANERRRAADQIRRIQARIILHAQQLALTNERWRAAATGRRNLEELIAEVFGVETIPEVSDPSA